MKAFGAFLIGAFLSLSLVSTAELFFRWNASRHWINRSYKPRPVLPLEPGLQEKLARLRLPELQQKKTDYVPGSDLDWSSARRTTDGQALYTPDGFFMPSQKSTVRLLTKSFRYPVYEATYTIDKFMRRATPAKTRHGTPSRPLLFLGCSYTFGEGVGDSENFPARVAERLQGARVYNFGIPGSSPADTLHRLTRVDKPWRTGVEPGGIAVFTLLDDHFFRVNKSSRKFARSGNFYGPDYALRDGKLEYLGPFIEAEPNATRFLTWLGGSELLQFFDVNLPPVGSRHFRLMSKLLAEMRSDLQSRFQVRDLLVAIFPGERTLSPKLIPYLQKEGLTVLDYSRLDLARLLSQTDRLPDGHPSRYAHQVYGDLLAMDLAAHGLFKEVRP